MRFSGPGRLDMLLISISRIPLSLMKSSRKQKARKAADTGSGQGWRRWMLLAVVLLAGAALALAFWLPKSWLGRNGDTAPQLAKEKIDGKPSSDATEPTKVVAAAESPYKNIRPDVQKVGSQACVACHEAEHASFLHTGMGRSMAEVDITREPPDGAFDHPPTRCRYEVYRKDGQMWHRELLLTDGLAEVVLQEHPVKYVCGSGHHSLTYLVEEDGFLVESPITWYTSRKAWGISPGYDHPQYTGFEREVGETCLFCHSGQIKALGKSLHRMQITEATIGCEQCHGPGELHVKRHEQKETDPGRAAGDIDDTIVNPARLSRELAEAVCQQCHLRAGASVLAKGKTFFDFRPGQRLSEYRQDYELDTPSKEMKVVGHVEQMHQSRCYQQSKTFSCLTCHNPHSEPEGKEVAAHYIQVCTSCHEPSACRVSESRRRKESPQNDCVACHMPRTATDIPHLAFTHHRVAIHEPAEKTAGAPSPPQSAGALRPMFDISHLSESEQKRSLGLAYFELAGNEADAGSRRHYQQQALDLLSQVRSSREVDGAMDVLLARLRLQAGLPDVQRYVQSALSDPELTGQDLCNALFLAADFQFQQRRYQEALSTLESLNRLRRNNTQWLLTAQCEKALGNEAAHEQALLIAASINPRLWKVHQQLAEIYRQRGDEQRATFHDVRAVP